MYRFCSEGAPLACAGVSKGSWSSALSRCQPSSCHAFALTQRRWLTAGRGGGPPLPPPLPPPPGSALRNRAGSKLPPPPPLTSAHLGTASGAGTTHAPATVLRSPQEVLTAFVSYIPTYYVSVPCVASVLPEELRENFVGRGRLLYFLKRFPFLFDMQMNGIGSSLVRLHRDVSHPQRGAADEKYMMTDVGETTSYIAKPEYITSTESLDSVQCNVFVKPPVPPPSVQVHLEERVPVVDRLRTLVPETFVSIEKLEENIPEDILFHPYFDCQGGLLSIAGKLPDEFQVVDGHVRRRPRHLAPLALDEYTLETSPFPEVAAMIKRAVCDSDIPHWVSITPLYEALSREQKHKLKQQFKSFAGFLRAHGRALAVSTDMLQVSMWICKNPPPLQPVLEEGSTPGSAQLSLDVSKSAVATEASPPSSSSSSSKPVTYTRAEIINAWYDRFPSHKTLNLRDAMELLPIEMRTSGLPKKIAPWLATHPHYFTVDYMEEEDPTKVLIRRASEWQPLDIAMALYAHMPDAKTEYDAAAVLQSVEPSLRRVVEELGMEQLGDVLPQWLRVTKRRGSAAAASTEAANFTLRRLQESDALQKEIQHRRLQKEKKKETGVTDDVDAEDMANLPR
ncbi:putative mitochondrial hypothetical protein [Leptomonas pyrrhocoris]|uniref:Uncharacterized protein n=1 Tax=Leptomonas pyrrhocoris TaxID=157538 RepID=A0A0N0VGG7_LEPPY|nr:putative mitochondrial hypothetical protein [Leptomonas pyrrhocoris]XP_015661464.1 putative mitochondrial hypothetical protein [Leptomonas pyrrhocoris]KPA83024.1 putative mitochondrial hypothetical protein [Leptomonas pyrrhocoris]KPA83025.1 putative mitochondrial hypothetical protein [Leptomonas pyrrhocoris]|eukprot:XP_015661463.1 putative mitochondrial hypothetical protein [Leptomonas pyrrhocoris]